MQGDKTNDFDPELFMRRVEDMLLMDDISEDQKLEILEKLLAIAEES